MGRRVKTKGSSHFGDSDKINMIGLDIIWNQEGHRYKKLE